MNATNLDLRVTRVNKFRKSFSANLPTPKSKQWWMRHRALPRTGWCRAGPHRLATPHSEPPTFNLLPFEPPPSSFPAPGAQSVLGGGPTRANLLISRHIPALFLDPALAPFPQPSTRFSAQLKPHIFMVGGCRKLRHERLRSRRPCSPGSSISSRLPISPLPAPFPSGRAWPRTGCRFLPHSRLALRHSLPFRTAGESVQVRRG